MKTWLGLAALCCQSAIAAPLDYYFDSAISFDPTIPTPQEVLGYEVGGWHVRHDQLVEYMRVLANKSDRVSIAEIGRSHEQRPLVLLSISAPSKQADLDKIRIQRLEAIAKGEGLAKLPAVTWMGYSVHGNEASGSNAALLVAYYLAASQDERVTQLLNDTIVLLDPSLNPDGLNRFASWANSKRSLSPSSDPNHFEHNEAWPSSRTNHYLFDLNRDWLLLQHPESRARVNAFHQWKPNVLTDFHEMGPNSTYFFQPGVPSRTNPITPEQNVTLTEAIGDFHAKALDKEKQLYFTKESFDDFYYGKGSTYPDINGSVGILFEQASSRGHLQQTINGTLSFSATIKNQLTTSLSTFDAVLANQETLKNYQQSFYRSAQEEAKKARFSGYVVDLENDRRRAAEFMSVVQQHQIEAYTLTQALKVENHKFNAKSSVYIPLSQPQYRVVEALFTEQTTFEDNTFYDVSGWTLPHAFDLPFAKVKRVRSTEMASTPWQPTESKFDALIPNSYAYVFEWQDSQAPALLNALLQQGVVARLASASFSAQSNGQTKPFKAGAVMIPAGLQNNTAWFTQLQKLANTHAIEVHSIDSGLTQVGIDLGSRLFEPAKLPRVLLVGGEGVSQYELGEVWHHLDTRLGIAPTIVEQTDLKRLSLEQYSHIILVDGRYEWSEATEKRVSQWIKDGGVIWGHKRGAQYLLAKKWLEAEAISSKVQREQFVTEGLSYGDQEALSAKQRIAGAIFATKVDITHPLTYGLEDSDLPVFKNATWLLKPTKSPFLTVAKYTDKPLLAGYTDPVYINNIAGNAALIAHKKGQGAVVAMTDNPVFRGYWHGTSRLLNNALFFGHTLTATPSGD
ncbi:Secreted protein containing N-terminal Zinc-dependent carboxypeptidase related domain [Pseudoalteromonas luteoviolacea B = ATCC 29581]|nr:Secreted protein containing N-terminal Zinc-dependent carboxypeptidase related domain [Pseudoalteromonas luteoviolacea B = ATCC 29581]